MSAVITKFENPPIPVRRFDWIAYMDGMEEDGPYGRGETELEAVKELCEQLYMQMHHPVQKDLL